MRWIKALTFSALLLFALPTAAFADITWNPVSQGFDMTDDEYFVTVSKESTGSFGFSGGKFVNPQGKYFDVVWVHTNRALASDISMDVTFGDGYTVKILLSSTSNQIPGAYFKDHPSKGITLKFNSDGRTNYKAYINSYGLQDYDGPSPSTAPTAAPTTAPTAAPTVKPSATPTPTPKPTASATANPTSPTATVSPDPGGSDGGDTGGNCLCPELCEIMPGVLAGFGDQLDGIKNALSPLHNDLAFVQNQLFGVRDDLYIMNGQLEQINSNTAPLHADLIDIKALTNELIRQLTPTQDYNVPSPIVLPNYYKPPDVASQPFTDNTQYFSDSGDAATPGAMPAAPEPKNWTFEGKEINQDAEMVPAPKQTQDPVMTASPDMQQDPVMTASPDMQQDPVMTASPDMQQDPNMKQDEILVKQPDLKMDETLEMETKEYPVRWDSSEFP
ncbi:hypothetical protein [Paenibacillus odorifer]|uniref:hypothetical protein n=1 Tax=Paenibacillus odorifer TaxID=189426 RepID=UPI00096EDA74|nr:hypothetical protein [Paenibacillus odorifer]OMD76579.1 hypothetical protein BSK50_14885 [Paenibacillus odorifer]